MRPRAGTLAGLALPVGFQLCLAAAVGLGLLALGFAVCLCRLQSGILFGQNVGHQGKGKGYCALRRGKALRQQGLGVPPERGLCFVGSGKGALGGSAGGLWIGGHESYRLTVNMNNCDISKNTSRSVAGGIYAGQLTTLNMNETTVAENTAKTYGGGLYTYG